MPKLKHLILLLSAMLIWYLTNGFWAAVSMPDVDLNEWWGPGTTKSYQNTDVIPFRVNFSEALVGDLRRRLSSYRPSAVPLEGIAFQYGFNSKELDNWIEYWTHGYNFSEREMFLNQFPQFKTNIQGLDIHFIRVKGRNIKSKEVLPLLILHGWPGSVREFFETIPHIIAVGKDRDFVVEVIAPSLPGYGFSDGPTRPGLGVDKMAVICRNLMRRLGFKQFYIQGGDLGALISNSIATFFPDEVLGYHTNAVFTQTLQTSFFTALGSLYPPLILNSNVVARIYPLSNTLSLYLEESGYLHIQATKPDTLGIALSDSPVGLAAYILEKFSTGTRKENRLAPDGGLSAFFTKDQLIDNLMMYWSSNSITSAVRLYAETFNKRYFGLRLNEIPSKVPTWVIQARNEITYLPPWLIRFKFPNLLNETLLEDGGHFLALEKPQVFAQNVLEAISAFRVWHKNLDREL